MEWKNYVKLAVISLLVYLVFRFLLPWLFPFLASIVIVWLARCWVEMSRRHLHLKTTASLLLFCAGTLLLLLFSAYHLILCVSEQGSRFFLFCRSCFPVWKEELKGFFCECEGMLGLPSGFLDGLLAEKADGLAEQVNRYLMERLPDQLVQAAAACMGVFVTMAVVLMASLLLYRDYDGIREELARQHWYPVIKRICGCVSASGMAYLKTQGIILLCVAVLNAAGLYLLGYQNTLFLGILIGIVDFLPILGAGTILIPWTLILLLQGSYGTASGVAAIYLFCFGIRQYLEPRLMGRGNGIRPFYMLICIYLGLRLFGIWGVFLGPLGVSLIRGIYAEWRK